MRIRLLGPVELWDGGGPVPVGPRARVVLATLAINAGQVVSMHRLIAAVWPGEPPATAVTQIHVCVSALRRALTGLGVAAARDLIVTVPPGYLLRAGPGEIDVLEFEQGLSEARAAADDGDPRRAASLLREALGLWRGPALEGFPGLAVEATRLEERRLAALEERAEADLALGRAVDLVPELTALVAEHPLRERLRALLMRALHRAGRRSEALDVYQDARRTLIDELGLEPGPDLRRAQQAVLADAETAGHAAGRGPGQPAGAVPAGQGGQGGPAGGRSALPPDIADFTGRRKQVAQAIDAITGLPQPRDAVPIVAITGRAGVGKTTLAVHVAHRLRGQFDARLYVGLDGAGPAPADPAEVLGRLLRRLGVDGAAIPDDPADRAESYRARLDGAHVLIVLDNAADERQIRPLLPGSPTCAVIVTSRRHLTGLPGAVHVELDSFDPAQATELLARVAGMDRVAAEPAAGERISALCDRLPLALRIAAARLAAKPHWSLQRLARRLADEHRRLDELTHADLEVRGSIGLSHQGLSPPAQRAFRLLGLLDAPDFAVWAAAALMDVPQAEAEEQVEELIDARLLEVAGRDETGQTRYRFHDLVRVYARECAAVAEPAAESRAALRRALSGWLTLAEAAEQRLANPYFAPLYGDAPRRAFDAETVEALLADPIAWFDAEQAAVVAGVRQAREQTLPDLCWELASAMLPYFELRGDAVDWRRCCDDALAAARAAGDQRGEAAALINFAGLYFVQSRYDEGGRCFALAAELCERIGADYGLAGALCGLASANRIKGALEESRARWRRGLEIFAALGDARAEAYATEGLGLCDFDQGRFASARTHFDAMLRLHQAAGNSQGQGQALRRLAAVELETGRYAAALELFKQALPVFRELGDRLGEAVVQMRMAECMVREGRHEHARRLLDTCMITFREVGWRTCEGHVLRLLGEMLIAERDAPGAAIPLQESVRIFRDLEESLDLAETLGRLGEAYEAMGEHAAARAARGESRSLLATMGRVTEDLAGSEA
ncbi:MAG TPA: BTAD domain-containing putative transcriptional regulator [Streptosporangiaceae bacterium]|nr:BTAD domain-containing putative transcriptional regulator [Streptosporangiaceae bacterium]